LATGYNGAVHGAPHCIDRGPDFCLRRSIGAHDAEKYNYCISSHAEVNAIDQAARFGISLDGAVLYCTLEPCNWCFKQLIQAGIKEIYFEEPYDSRNKDFDLYWRRIMQSHEGLEVFEQVSVSKEALDMVIEVLHGSSARKIAATSPDQEGDMDIEALAKLLGDEGADESGPIPKGVRKLKF
jgi:dCMP deaminase